MTAIVNAARFVRAPLQAVARRQYSAPAVAPAAGYSGQRVAIAAGVGFAAGCDATVVYYYFKKPAIDTA